MESMEDLIGGRVFAWVGGLAVLLGIAFLFAIGVSSGWIGEGARTLLGAVVCSGLVGAGIWLHGHRGRTDAAVAALACGISGLFVTITVAAQVYDLIPSLAGTALAVAVGSIATALAVRWESRGIAALGILGGLCAPVLAGSDIDGGSVAILFVVLAAAAVVLLAQRWNWLALAGFAIATPQWAIYLFETPSPSAALLTLVGFGGLGMVVAVGHDVWNRAESLRSPAAFLLALNAIVIAGVGWYALSDLGEPTIGKLWLVGLAVAYALAGVLGPKLAGLSRDLGLLSLTLAVLVADVAFALLADGPVLSIGWTATAVCFAALLRRTRRESGTEDLVGCGLGGHLAIAIVTAFTVDDPTAVLAGEAPLTAAGAAAFASIAAGCIVSARLAEERGLIYRWLLDASGLAAVALLTAMVLDGPVLALSWCLEVVVLTLIARRRNDEVAGGGALAFLALATLHVVTVDAPFELVGSLAALSALLPVAAVAVTALGVARVLPDILDPDDPRPLTFALDIVGLAAVAYLPALAFDGPLLTVAFAAEAAVLALAAKRWGDVTLLGGSLSLLGLAALHAVAYCVPPEALITGLDDPIAAIAVTSAVLTASIVAGEWSQRFDPRVRQGLQAFTAMFVLYAASALVVTPFETGNAVESTLLSAHQQGQMVLSVFWGLVGVAAVVVGLRRDSRPLRLAALSLLGVAVAKVFLFDLATLTSVYRAVSFIGLGLLLMLGAFVWQRLRPRALPDIREVPEALR